MQSKLERDKVKLWSKIGPTKPVDNMSNEVEFWSEKGKLYSPWMWSFFLLLPGMCRVLSYRDPRQADCAWQHLGSRKKRWKGGLECCSLTRTIIVNERMNAHSSIIYNLKQLKWPLHEQIANCGVSIQWTLFTNEKERHKKRQVLIML